MTSKLSGPPPSRSPAPDAAAHERYRLPSLLTLPGERRAASLGEKAYYILRDKIVQLKLRPGDTISEQELMDELGLGRTPLREAVQRLAQEKLVTLIPQRGTYVSELNLTDLARLTELRIELCGFAAALAAQRADHGQRSGMLRLHQQISNLPDQPGERRMLRIDQRVHAQIGEATHNPFLQEALQRYYYLSMRLWFLVMDGISTVRAQRQVHPGIAQYAEVLQAIAGGDGPRAEAVMRRHIQEFAADVTSVL